MKPTSNSDSASCKNSDEYLGSRKVLRRYTHCTTGTHLLVTADLEVSPVLEM